MEKVVVDVDDVINSRDDLYGGFDEVANFSQRLKEVIRSGKNWENLSDVEKEALDMVCNKISRILFGKLGYLDNWVDVSGYSKLVVNYIQQNYME